MTPMSVTRYALLRGAHLVQCCAESARRQAGQHTMSIPCFTKEHMRFRSRSHVQHVCAQGSKPTEVATLAAENAMLRRQLAEGQQLAAAQGGATEAGESPRQQLSGDAQYGGWQRVLGLDGSWVEQTWVTVRCPSVC